MDTIDYPTRPDLVKAVVDFRKRGIAVEVVGNGKTLKFPDGIGSTAEDETPLKEEEQEAVVPPAPDEEESLLGVVTPEQPVTPPAPDQQETLADVKTGGTPEQVAGGAAGEQSEVEDEHTGDSVSQTQPATEQPAGDPQGDDVEDLIGAPAPKPTPPAHPTKSQKRNRNRS